MIMFSKNYEEIGSVEPLLSLIKRWKLAHFGHTIRHESLHKVIMQGFVEGKRRQGLPRMNWMFNIIEWTKSDIGDLLENTLDREKWKKTCVIVGFKSSLRPTCHMIKVIYVLFKYLLKYNIPTKINV